MTPILPVRPADLPAWHGLAQDAAAWQKVDSTYGGLPCHRIRQGVGPSILLNGTVYCADVSSSHQRALSELPKSELPVVPTVAEGSRMDYWSARISLGQMAKDAGFQWIGRQADYIARLSLVDGALIAADVGTGKTGMAIALIHLRKPRRCLVVAPQGVIRGKRSGFDEAQVYHSSQWEQEFARFAPWLKVQKLNKFNARCEGHAQVFLTYYQEFFQNGNGGLAQFFTPDFFDMVILDEAQLCINPEVHLSQQVFKLDPRIRYAMTATPVPNRLDEVFPLLAWLRPDWKYSKDGFSQLEGREWVELEGKHKFRVKPTAPACPMWVRRELSGIVAAIRKRDLNPQLPEVKIEVVKVDLTPEERKQYLGILDHVPRKRMSAGQLVRWKIGKLRTVCANAEAKHREVGVQVFALWDCQKQVVVASARIEFTDWMAKRLKHEEIRYSRIDSESPADEHSQQAAAFKRCETAVMLMGVRCAYGYSWAQCTNLIIASPDWGYGTVFQTIGRIHRITSKHPVHVTIYVCRNTIEETMVETLAMKESAANAVLFGADDGAVEASPDAILQRAAQSNST